MMTYGLNSIGTFHEWLWRIGSPWDAERVDKVGCKPSHDDDVGEHFCKGHVSIGVTESSKFGVDLRPDV